MFKMVAIICPVFWSEVGIRVHALDIVSQDLMAVCILSLMENRRQN